MCPQVEGFLARSELEELVDAAHVLLRGLHGSSPAGWPARSTVWPGRSLPSISNSTPPRLKTSGESARISSALAICSLAWGKSLRLMKRLAAAKWTSKLPSLVRPGASSVCREMTSQTIVRNASGVSGFCKKSIAPSFIAFTRMRNVSVRGDDDDRRLDLLLADLFQQLEAIHFRHSHIENDQ